MARRQRLLAPLAWTSLVLAFASTVAIAACGDDDDTTGGASRTGGDPDAAIAEAAVSNNDSSSPVDPGAEAGPTGTKELGADCTGDGDCKSGHCLTQGLGQGSGDGGGTGGGDGGKKGSFCSVTCTGSASPNPACSDPVFTGKCGGKGLCQLK